MPRHGTIRYCSTAAIPALVTVIDTGLASVAGAKAPDDDISNRCTTACGRDALPALTDLVDDVPERRELLRQRRSRQRIEGDLVRAWNGTAPYL